MNEKLNYKGIVLAGGLGSRLYPSTYCISKQLLPVYDKPMIYYSLSILLLAEIYDILIITTPLDIDRFQQLLGDGSKLGINIEYLIQSEPKGLADAFLLGEQFIDNSSVCLILGDNIFYGSGMSTLLLDTKNNPGSTVFAYKVSDPCSYGIVDFDKDFKAINIEEKPQNPKSNYAITGLYFYDNKVTAYAKTLKPSKRNELEITDINNIYIKNNSMNVTLLNRGFAWLDTGTHDSLNEASNFIRTIEKRQGIKVACLEEIALRKKLINKNDVYKLLHIMGNNSYSQYLRTLLNEID